MNTIWPNNKNTLSVLELETLQKQLIGDFEKQLNDMSISQDLTPFLNKFHIPFAAWLSQKQFALNDTLIVGINGAQGSGKSTMSQLTANILRQGFNLTTVILSIDDLYKTRQQRSQMASDIHPLFQTRGVPGTHDTALGLDIIDKIKTLKIGESLAYPSFDKSNDEPLSKTLWPRCYGPIDVLIFEGWCVGATAQVENDLKPSVNALEELEDNLGVWRHTVNEHLKSDYKTLFDLLDCLVFLQIPNFDCILKWRGLQEQKLADKQQHKKHLMTTEASLQRFIAHYERLTRFQLAEIPNKADLVIKLGEDHQISQLAFKY